MVSRGLGWRHPALVATLLCALLLPILAVSLQQVRWPGSWQLLLQLTALSWICLCGALWLWQGSSRVYVGDDGIAYRCGRRRLQARWDDVRRVVRAADSFRFELMDGRCFKIPVGQFSPPARQLLSCRWQQSRWQ
ncbi:MAG TPA: YcxB family protein [Spongiibacteraceae bacterium]|jgi:hypothetical protein|nr:YcxB family protein [Spongiibacteraceae bacterium]HUH37847.1 YcxB family protein [Spongiibacteraceae bacterium]